MKKMTIAFIIYGLLLVGCTHKEQLKNSNSAVKSNSETKMEEYDVKQTEIDEVQKELNELVTKVYDKELGMWVSEMNAMLSLPFDDPRLKETKNDEGFEYYLKAEKVADEYPNQLDGAEIEKVFDNLLLLKSYISHYQFARTAHLDPNGLAMEDTSLSHQWNKTEEKMRQAFKYMKQIMNDLDVVLNHGGEGETFGVTHLSNGDKVSEMESFISGAGSGWE